MARATKVAKPKAPKPKAPKPNAARPKAAKGATLLERIDGVVLPTDAYGLARVPAKTAASERAAVLLGLGYPKMLIVTDEPLPPLASYAEYKRRYLDARVVPRALLPTMHAVARAVPAPDALDAAVAAPPAVRLDDAVEKMLRHGGPIFVLEGLFGSTKVAQAVVAALVASKGDDLAGGKYENYGYGVIGQLGYVLWRVPTKIRDGLRAELAKLLERLRADDQMWRAGKALDMILGGRAGVERSASRFGNQPNGHIHFGSLLFADDDPAWVADQLAKRFAVLRPADREVFDIQLAVVGGPKALALLRKNTAAFKKDQAASIAEQLSLVR